MEIDDIYRDPAGFLAQQCETAKDRRRIARALTWPDSLRVLLLDVVPLPDGQHAGRWIVPFWASWDLPADVTDVRRLSRTLIEVFTRLREGRGRAQAEITYVSAELTERDRWQGRGMLAVDVPVEWIRDSDTDALGTLAKRAEELALDSLLIEQRLPAHAVTLGIAWGERWLSRPSDG